VEGWDRSISVLEKTMVLLLSSKRFRKNSFNNRCETASDGSLKSGFGLGDIKILCRPTGSRPLKGIPLFFWNMFLAIHITDRISQAGSGEGASLFL
jgi:hypothetical protein